MADSANNPTPLPTVVTAEHANDPKWWLSMPDPVRKLLVAFGTVLLSALVALLAARYGIKVPDPVIVTAEKEHPKAEAIESPTQFYCGRLETLGDNQTTRPWPVKRLTWTVEASKYRGGISAFQLREAFTVAWATWASRIDIEPVYVESEADALIVCRFGDIDGSGRVLAWSELADGTTTPKHQLYDAGERWEIAAVPTQIDIVRVVAHEIGHVLGLYHDSEESGALMAPMYDRNVRFPTERDAKRLLAMGYKAKAIPPGQKPVLPPLSITIDAAQIFDQLEKAGWELKKK